MSATVLYMSMSLDGFIAGPTERLDNPVGDGGGRLHEWSFNHQIPVNGQIYDEFMATGAIVAGRGPSGQPMASGHTMTASDLAVQPAGGRGSP